MCFLLVAPFAFCAETSEARPTSSKQDLRFWLENMVWFHRYTAPEIAAATGLLDDEIDQSLKRFGISSASRPEKRSRDRLLVLPYPGGRHPRIGFLEGAIRPQRETKLSLFAPWDDGSYVVLDLPEALWSNLGLTYLAHTHIPTIWTKRGLELPKLEWERRADGSFRNERALPNGIAFGCRAWPDRDSMRAELWLRNGSTNALTDLRVQICAMLKGAAGFSLQTNTNKVFEKPFAACRSSDGRRWVILAWEQCHRVWGNAPVPCLHSDPKFSDSAPGSIETLRGWFSFYEGEDIAAEFRRIRSLGWLRDVPASSSIDSTKKHL